MSRSLQAITFCITMFVYSADFAFCAAAEPSPDDGLTIINDIAYREGESKNWTLDLSMPAGKPTSPRPAIVVIHGGGWIQGDKSSFSRPQKTNPGHIRHFARQGYVAVTINYRLAAEGIFPAAVNDCKNAVRFLRAHADEYGIDSDRIGAWGNSAGGHLALMLGMVGPEAKLEGDGPFQDQSSLVQAVCSDSGPIELVYQYHHKQVEYAIIQFLGGPPEGDRLLQYQLATPSHYIAKNMPPMLLIYGVDDEQVGIETSDQFVAALDKAGNKDVSYHRLAQVGHCPFSLKGIPTVPAIVDDFFARTLRLKPATSP